MKFLFYYLIIVSLLVSNIELSSEDNERGEDVKLLKDFLDWLKYYLKSKNVKSEQNNLVKLFMFLKTIKFYVI